MFKVILLSISIVFVNSASLEVRHHGVAPVQHEIIEPIHTAEHVAEKTVVENSIALGHGDITKPKETITTVHSEESVVTEPKPQENQVTHLPIFLQQILPTAFAHALEQLVTRIPGFRSGISSGTNVGFPLGYQNAYPPWFGVSPGYPRIFAPIYLPPGYIGGRPWYFYGPHEHLHQLPFYGHHEVL